jgi:hypothetical protein
LIVTHAGIRWDLELTYSKGAGYSARLLAVWPIDPDAWHAETTAHPFTRGGAMEWYEEGGDAEVLASAIASATPSPS